MDERKQREEKEKIRSLGVNASNLKSGLLPSRNPMLNPKFHFLLLPNCNANERCLYWLGALNNVTTIGCGINVLRFMGEIDEPNAQKGLSLTYYQDGTPFKLVTDWFQHKFTNMGVFMNDGYIRTVEEFKYDISTKENLQVFFNRLNYFLPNNSCILVKYNRHDDRRHRPGNLTAGHYVLISKDFNGKLFTYEPLTSNKTKCDKREYKGMVSDRFFTAFRSQGYITASVLVIKVERHQLFRAQRGGTDEITETFLMPEDIYSDFINKLNESIECKKNKIGGKKNRKSRKRRSRKRRKSIKKTRK